MKAWVWCCIALIGGAGAVARFLLDGLIGGRLGRRFPYGTLAINLSGAVLLGLLTGLAVKGNLMVIIGTAAIGSYTTFSTWMLETQRLAEGGEIGAAALNVVLSVGLGFGAAALGRTIGAHL
jgi:CrcB protein